eukprot:1194312-Prorocentrum_minimum.AAC.3
MPRAVQGKQMIESSPHEVSAGSRHLLEEEEHAFLNPSDPKFVMYAGISFALVLSGGLCAGLVSASAGFGICYSQSAWRWIPPACHSR